MAESFEIAKVIADRRDGRKHTEADLRNLALSCGQIPDYQLAAWLMAAYLRPLDEDETAWLTVGMAASGKRLDLSGIPKPSVDKHSTGGVGDKTSLVLLPILAAGGITVIKMSGRGLGITGGTLDKLSSVPGFRLDLSPEELLAQARRIGIALTGQSSELAPADKVLYALRDATETVASIPLIVSSILSKKIAGGAKTVVIDVKCGSGAFMTDLNAAQRLANSLRETGKRSGIHVLTEISDMSQPLGSAVGNSLEVVEALRVLRNESLTPPEQRFESLVLSLARTTFRAAGVEGDPEQVLRSGLAFKKAEEWFTAQGATSMGPTVEQTLQTSMCAAKSGYLAKIDAGEVGRLLIELGGGRRKKEDRVDLQVGIRIQKLVGDLITAGEPVLTVFSRSPIPPSEFATWQDAILEISSAQIEPPPMFLA